MRFKGALTTALALVLFVTMLLLMTLPSVAQSGVTNFTNIKASGDVIAGDDLVAGDDATIADNLTTADLYATQSSSQTITFGGTITPTGMYHQITAAAARGTSSVAGVDTAGRVVVLVNVGSNTITLTDTGTLRLSGNIALGQFDSLTLLSDGANWVQVSTANN